jgi:polysaccharide pyruvyl transferase WcaK-like protein
MARVLLLGAFGQGNPGDEALLRAFRDGLAPHEVVVASSDPQTTSREHGCPATSSRDPRAVLGALTRADAVVVGGGTIFKTLHPATGRHPRSLLRRTRAVIAAAHMLRRPVALAGVGAGSLPDRAARRLAVSSAQAADLLLLRDEESAEVLRGAGLPRAPRVGADAAWRLFEGPGLASRGRSGVRPDRVVVALSAHAGGEDLADSLSAGLAALVERGCAVQLQPWQVGPGQSDTTLAAAVARRLQVEVLSPPDDLEDARRVFSDAGLVVTLRFHGLVAAGAAGVPALAVAHEPKLAGLARRLGQPTVDAGALARQLGPAMTAALEGAAPPSPAAVAAQVAAATEDFGRVRELVSHAERRR